jgi:hypothetical protein
MAILEINLLIQNRAGAVIAALRVIEPKMRQHGSDPRSDLNCLSAEPASPATRATGSNVYIGGIQTPSALLAHLYWRRIVSLHGDV